MSTTPAAADAACNAAMRTLDETPRDSPDYYPALLAARQASAARMRAHGLKITNV